MTGRCARTELWALGLVTALAALLRWLYVTRQDLSIYDPWRHLLLVDNLRQGLGYTLFDGQPYLWYSPIWYYVAAAVGPLARPATLAALLSLAAVPLYYLWLRRAGEGLPPAGASAGALLLAAFGPVVSDTCHPGSEAFALALTTGALLVSTYARGAAASGLMFGIALVARLNLALNVFLFLPSVRRPRQLLAFAFGLTLPLALTWWRNREILRSYDYVFTWDGLATRTADFNAFSTLVLQAHPAVAEALRRLHRQILPVPEWWTGRDLLIFMILGVVCLLAARRPHLMLAGLGALASFWLLDTTLSAHFFRIYLGALPAIFAAIAHCATRLRQSARSVPRVAGASLVAVALICGIRPALARLRLSDELMSLERVTPPPELLPGRAYMVNSGFYHPESLAYRYRDKRFIGLPLGPDQFEDFRRRYAADYPAIVWQEFCIQDALADHLARQGYRPTATGTNRYGRRYTILEPPLADGG